VDKLSHRRSETLIRWIGHVARVGEIKKAYRLVGNPERERLLGRPRCRWEVKVQVKSLCLTKHHSMKN
jgi:hypothetical protein